MPTVTTDDRGRHVVATARRVYGRYPTLDAAVRRLNQIRWSRMPAKKREQ